MIIQRSHYWLIPSSVFRIGNNNPVPLLHRGKEGGRFEEGRIDGVTIEGWLISLRVGNVRIVLITLMDGVFAAAEIVR